MNSFPDLVTGISIKDNKVFVMENNKHHNPKHKSFNLDLSSRIETPGGKIDETDIDHQHALKRELKEEFGVEVEVGKYVGPIATSTHSTKERIVHTYHVTIIGEPKNMEPHKCGRFGYYNLQELQGMVSESTILTPNLVTVLKMLEESGQMT
jgi:8-oxo-dGTP pyrophosphatase MutT (NUDIX family)